MIFAAMSFHDFPVFRGMSRILAPFSGAHEKNHGHDFSMIFHDFFQAPPATLEINFGPRKSRCKRKLCRVPGQALGFGAKIARPFLGRIVQLWKIEQVAEIPIGGQLPPFTNVCGISPELCHSVTHCLIVRIPGNGIQPGPAEGANTSVVRTRHWHIRLNVFGPPR